MEPPNVDPALLEERCRRLENQVSTIKQVSQLRKTLLELRERQVKDLISKLKFYEIIVTEERESRHSLSVRLESAETQCGQLTEKLAKNCQTIDEMKENYENKVSTLISELQTSEQRNQQLSDQLNCAQLRITEVTKGSTLEELNKKLEEKDRFVTELQNQMRKIWERNKALSYQMTLLNNLFSETEGVSIDFEKIKAIGDIVRESQALSEESEDEVMGDDLDPFKERRHSFDLENLLDSIEKSENVMPADIPGEESCYKSVDTKRGPQLVLSVSRTFIKLKDLIVEKKSLQKEIETLKTLNTKLESKVDKQEHRLYRVTMELNKTWSLVSKLKQQHKRLYNSEAVLRYELQEKRALLDKLKNELSASREKWRRVRQKNSQSQIEWEKLRDEFAQRKHQSSQESGTFSEVMSVSSGENDGTTLAEVEDEQTIVRSRRSSKVKGIKGSKSSERLSNSNGTESEDEEGPEEEESEDGARALSPLEDESYEDPLEELVSNLVADIDNEADTEEESVSVSANRPAAPQEDDSSPSPDFEDLMRRRANRLRKLEMLEQQASELHKKLQVSTARNEALSTKLAVLHDHYGPAGSSSMETPNDHCQQNVQDGDAVATDVSQKQEEVDISQTQLRLNDDEISTTSTDAAYVSGTENNGVREETPVAKNNDDTPPTTTEENNATSLSCHPSKCDADKENNTNSTQDNLIEISENRTDNAESPLPSEEISKQVHAQNENATQESQGCSNNEERQNDSTLLSVAVPLPNPSSCPPLQENASNASEELKPEAEECACETGTETSSRLLVESSMDSSNQNQNHEMVAEGASINVGDIPNTLNEQNSQNVSQQDTPPPPLVSSTDIEGTFSPSAPLEEPLPIQETVVQHFPSTSEEEANEFAPVQIRPEFLRILQEADEATNSLDWMPSLLTITHSVALLRLDPELPPERNGSTNTGSQNRSVSESLSIEIPQESPTTLAAFNHNCHAGESVNNRRTNSEQVPQDSNSRTTAGTEEERLPAYAKDPSFLSRMIIKQLPKRLQLLKNENHTLQMETAEAKMRMKEMKRQLSKEASKQEQLSLSLDAQIEEKNLIEFELREEIEKKEKVIEELQMEIDASKEYVDELKKEKEDANANLEAILQEKMDMEQPEVPATSVKDCTNCKRTFSLLTRRKFHCKICGKVFCKDCAVLREPNKRSSKRPRLCTRCHFRRQRIISTMNSIKVGTPE